MKKNIENQVENVNTVENNVTEEQAKQFVADNLYRVSKVMRSRFDALPLAEQVNRINRYIEREQEIAKWKERSRMINRVKELFEKKHATVSDAKEVMKYCEEFINNYKAREIEKLDEQIRKLQLMKESLN